MAYHTQFKLEAVVGEMLCSSNGANWWSAVVDVKKLKKVNTSSINPDVVIIDLEVEQSRIEPGSRVWILYTKSGAFSWSLNGVAKAAAVTI